jgi:putative inorganic carbon (HCO3(-)) transporter
MMSSQNIQFPTSDTAVRVQQPMDNRPYPPVPPTGHGGRSTGLSPFWRDRLFEGGLILSMALYYIVGNSNIAIGGLSHLNPLVSLPFLLVFAVLCWYRLPFAIALLPLALPYYLLQKAVVSHYRFSLIEVALATCVVVALLRLLFRRGDRRYLLSLSELRDRLGPFVVPIAVFFLAAALSVVIAYDRTDALRAFREEVFDPLLYLGLAFLCLRSRQDVLRLLSALLGTGLVIALLGLAQFFLFKNTLVLEDGVRRVHTVYGSANSIGLLFDYVLPIGLALVMARVSWRKRLFALALCLPLLVVLYLTQSLGAWVAIALSSLFIVVLSIRSRKLLLVGALVVVIGLAGVFAVFHSSILNRVADWHSNQRGISTVTKRLYLWQTAADMIHDRPWLGYGMDNWLCYYSRNNLCDGHGHLPHYWILNDPVTHAPTGLHDEPTLSHPHDIFLQVWVSMGIFGLLAFVAVLVLFYWLFARILRQLRSMGGEPALRWMTVAVGAAMLAALVQGLVDSAFLEQDLAFCFWMLVAALLLLRVFAGVPWKDVLSQEQVDQRL